MRARGGVGTEVCAAVSGPSVCQFAPPGRGSAAGGPPVAAAAGRGAGEAALGADGGQLAAAQEPQGLAEGEG